MARSEMTTSSSNLYPEELQLKLYQAFIFSIPILFSIILFLLFYLFYLKTRSSPTTPSSFISSSLHHHSSSFLSPQWNSDIKGEIIKDKLHVIHFDEQLKERDSLCCVCLGEFEMKEELHQLPSCKHVFHGDCIRHWLRGNATCPLCRRPVISVLPALIKPGHPVLVGSGLTHQANQNSIQTQPLVQDNLVDVGSSSNVDTISSTSQEHLIQMPAEAAPSSSISIT